jgi:hypothetical protein
MTNHSGEGLGAYGDPVAFLRNGYVVRGHDVAAADQECRPAAPGQRMHEHANRSVRRKAAVTLLASILDEDVGGCRFGDDPEGDARSGQELRASDHQSAPAILRNTM